MVFCRCSLQLVRPIHWPSMLAWHPLNPWFKDRPWCWTLARKGLFSSTSDEAPGLFLASTDEHCYIHTYAIIHTYIYIIYTYIYIYVNIHMYICFWNLSICTLFIIYMHLYAHIFIYAHKSSECCCWHLIQVFADTSITSLNQVVLGEHRSWQPLPVFIDPIHSRPRIMASAQSSVEINTEINTTGSSEERDRQVNAAMSPGTSKMWKNEEIRWWHLCV